MNGNHYNLFESEVFIKVVGTSLDIFGNVRTSSGNCRKSSEVADENLTLLTRKKLAGIEILDAQHIYWRVYVAV